MIAALTLLAGVVAAGWLVPHALRRVDLRRRDPLVLIVAWLVSTAGVLVATATGVLLLLPPDHGPGASLLAAAHTCWSAIQHGSPPRIEEIAGLVGLGLLAVLAHERAHLTGRHHQLVAIADAVRTTFPFVPLFRHSPRAIRDLVELAADVGAARDRGPAAVHTALLRVARHRAPTTSLAMAQEAVDLRLARLRLGARSTGGGPSPVD